MKLVKQLGAVDCEALEVPEGGTLFAEVKADLLANGQLELAVQIFRDNDGDGEPDDSFRIRIMGRIEGDLSSGETDVEASQEDIEDNVTICHVPPGNPDNAHTIVVGAPAVQARLALHEPAPGIRLRGGAPA